MTQEPNLRADAYFAIIPEWLLHAEISDKAVRLYGILRRYADKELHAWPSRKTLAGDCRCSVDAIDRALKELVSIGAISKKFRKGPDGDLTSNQYTILSLPSRGGAATGGRGNAAETIANMNDSQFRKSRKKTDQDQPIRYDTPDLETTAAMLEKERTGDYEADISEVFEKDGLVFAKPT